MAEVLHSGQWNGLELLVQSPLPVSENRARPSAEQVGAAQVEVAGIGRTEGGPLATSAYWADLRRGSRSCPTPPRRPRWPTWRPGSRRSSARCRWTSAPGTATGRPGTPPCAGDRLLVWDWERFAVGVPVGYDALHWALQTDLVNHLADPGEAARESLVQGRFGAGTASD